MLSFDDFLKLIDSGGNVAVMVCVWFIWKQNNRLIKIETVLELFLDKFKADDE